MSSLKSHAVRRIRSSQADSKLAELGSRGQHGAGFANLRATDASDRLVSGRAEPFGAGMGQPTSREPTMDEADRGKAAKGDEATARGSPRPAGETDQPAAGPRRLWGRVLALRVPAPEERRGSFAPVLFLQLRRHLLGAWRPGRGRPPERVPLRLAPRPSSATRPQRPQCGPSRRLRHFLRLCIHIAADVLIFGALRPSHIMGDRSFHTATHAEVMIPRPVPPALRA